MLRSRTEGSQDSGATTGRLVGLPVGAQMTILERGPVLGIIRYRVPCDLRAVIDAVLAGDVPLVEITIDTPGALDAIERAASDGIAIGAGTVTTPDEVRACADAGARFVVSPAFVPEMVTSALAGGVEPIPGILSPSELLAARRSGAEAVKVFPAGPAGGPSYVRALRGPFPDVPLLPTGGIGPRDVTAYLEAGATCVGLGATLVGSEPPSAADLDAIRARAADATAAMRS
jgi:2-dehydro-3-deoxyphosphogluconate aldolase/(4S)-4-hydroxy-2-oxoglutarate aldolase